MEKMELLGITRSALEQLCGPTKREIPNQWFQWNFQSKSGDISRLTCFDGSADPTLETWYETSRRDGFEPILLLGKEDGLPETVNCPELLLLTLGLKGLDRDAYSEFLNYFSQPDDYVLGECWSIINGGGLHRLDDRLVPPGFWASYGESLRRWYENYADPASIPKPFVDFANWSTDRILGAECFDLTSQVTFDGKRFFPMKALPCCGVTRSRDGKLEPHGLLPANWKFDPSGALRKHLQSDKVAPESVAGVIVGQLQRLCQAFIQLPQIRPATELQSTLASSSRRREIAGSAQSFAFDSDLTLLPDSRGADQFTVGFMQEVTVSAIPDQAIFDLTTCVRREGVPDTSLEVAMVTNGAEPLAWKALPASSTVKLNGKVRAADRIEYLLRRKV